MPHLSDPSRIAIDGRTWTRAEYARFLVVDAGQSRAEAATETGLNLAQVRLVTGTRALPDYAVGSLERGVRPFLRPGTRVVDRTAAQSRARDARALEREARRMLEQASALRHS